jgi:hypothetical protein
VNYAGANFRLASATLAGLTLPSPFNTDLDGNTRGADGVWDRGAYEYTTNSVSPATNSANATLTTGGASNATITVVTNGSGNATWTTQ